MPFGKTLERRVAVIELRNRKVEEDKAWETSYARRALVAVFTYFAIGAYLAAIGVADPWLNAIVPAAAFMLSSLTLPFFKKLWLKRFYRS
jgi:hypothetical protein